MTAALTFKDLLNALVPDFKNITILIPQLMLYFIILMYVICLFLQKQGNMQLTIFLAIGIVAAIINQLGTHNLDTGTTGLLNDMVQNSHLTFANWMLDILMIVFPLVVVGMTKAGRSRLPGLLGVATALIFLFGTWFAHRPA